MYIPMSDLWTFNISNHQLQYVLINDTYMYLCMAFRLLQA